GLIPALQAIRRESLGSVHSWIKGGGRGSTGSGQGRAPLNVLVASEVALSLVLLIGAGLMIRTLFFLQRVEPGFRASNVLRTQITLPPAQYGPDRQVSFFTQLVERTRSLPGVLAASAVMCLPLSGGCWSNPVEI